MKSPEQSADVIACDVTKNEDRQRVLKHIQEKYGRIDVLFANAGISTRIGKQLDFSEEIYDKTFNVNVKSTFFIIKESLSLLRMSK